MMFSSKPGQCNVCGFGHKSREAAGLSFHNISKKLSRRPIADKWLEFLFLPPTNLWPNKDWQFVKLCSRHFQEEDFNARQVFLRRVLNDDAVPTRHRPNGPGSFEASFSRGETNTVTSEIAPSPEEQEEVIHEPFTLKSGDSYSDQDVTEEDHPDPAYFDHDYDNNVKFDGRQRDGNCKENLNDSPRKSILQDLRKDLCRLCGQKGGLLQPIFDPSADMSDVSVSGKIHMHLPFKVNVDDKLPCHICLDCSLALNHWHDFYVTCVAADAVLKKTFDGESQMSPQEDWNESSNRDQNQINPYTSDAEPLVGAGSNEDIAVLNADNETKEENEIVCSVCGMNTPTKPPKEDYFFPDFGSFSSKFPYSRWKCNFCHEVFPNRQAKNEHTNHCRESSAICEICGKNVPRKNLVRHKHETHDLSVCVCDKCGKIFESIHLFNLHIKRMHKQGNIPRFCCNLCCIAFTKEENYVSHQKKHQMREIKTGFEIKEQPEGEVYICPVCNGTYNDVLSLVVHLNSKRWMKCPACQKNVSNEKKLLIHVCGKYKCHYCPKTYSSKADYIIHERLHTGEKPIKCRVCNESFRSRQHRYKHELRHAPLQQCSICSKKFKNKYRYRDHMQWHQGKVFSCPICQKGFGTRINVSGHVRKVHKGCRAKVS